MNKEDYQKIVKEKTCKEPKVLNMFIAFFIGGMMGIIGQLLFELFHKVLAFSIPDSYMYVMIVLVVIASIFTGLGFFDKIVSFAKCGLIVPSTGFAHAMTSSAMDSRKEGYVKGIGSGIFKLTGSIILFGIVVGFIVALIKGLLL